MFRTRLRALAIAGNAAALLTTLGQVRPPMSSIAWSARVAT